MNVELSAAVLADASAVRHLDAIGWLFVDGRHRWVVTDLEDMCRSAWLRSAIVRAPELCEHAEKAARALLDVDLLVMPLGTPPRVQGRCWVLPADIAETVMRSPLVVIVENSVCDGAFLRHLVLRHGEARLRRRLGEDCFTRLREKWANATGDGDWFRVQHGGGSTTSGQLQLVASATPAGMHRIFALVDSDRALPNAAIAPTSTAGQVVAMCSQLAGQYPALRVDLHVLDMREVENYLPRDVLLQYDHNTTTTRWDQLSEPDRDHVDLKLLYDRRLWRTLVEPTYDALFRPRAFRGVAEIDQIVDKVIRAM